MLSFRGQAGVALRQLVSAARVFSGNLQQQDVPPADADSWACWLAVLALAGESADEILDPACALHRFFPRQPGVELLQRVAVRRSAADMFRIAAATPCRPLIHAELAAQTGCDDSLPYLVETLLAHYDARQRRARGVYFTPIAAVDFLLQAVDQVLEDHFAISCGLRAMTDVDHGLRLIDPACGAALFLQRAARRLGLTGAMAGAAGERGQRWLSACRGLEVLPAACAAARWLLWRELGRPALLESIQQAVGCGSALEPAGQQWLASHSSSHNGPLLVVGNPPYANFGRCNRDPWIVGLLEEYKQDLVERKHNLHDDYVKFLRWAQYNVDQAGSGIVAFVTNHAYLSGLTHRGMRSSLLRSFDHLYVLDLHGGITKRERSPAGQEGDENIFPIRTGVALSLLVKLPQREHAAQVWHSEQWGGRRAKLEFLQQQSWRTVPWTRVALEPPLNRFRPPVAAAPRKYTEAPRLDEIFIEYVSGVQTKNDALLVDRDRSRLLHRMLRHLSGAPERHRNAERTGALPPPEASGEYTQPYLVAPFDQRWVFYEPGLLGRARWPVMRHMLRDNLGLVFMRQSTNGRAYDHFLVVRYLVSDRVFYSGHGAPYLAPLWRYEAHGRTANLRSEYVAALEQRLGISFVEDRQAVAAAVFDARDVLAFVYGQACSSAYRRRFDNWLRTDFPRIPWPDDGEQFRRCARVGAELMRLHCDVPQLTCDADIDEDAADERGWRIDRGFPRFEILSQHAASGRLWLNGERHLDGVPRAAWETTIGGYAVLPRWLKQRRGVALGGAAQRYLQALIEALHQTDLLVRQL
jgi:predicted helicase